METQTDFSTQTLLAFFFGVMLGGGVTYVLLGTAINDHDYHPITNPYDSEYHVHADFLIYINDEQIDLSDDAYMTTSEQQFHPDAHLHDNEGDVKHIHAENITFVSFLDSLGIDLTEQCIGLFEETNHCIDEEHVLQMYVNESLWTEPIDSYIPVDDDRILVYYGKNDTEKIATYNEAIPYDACYYSGTCPERGIAPAESCGLTCEL